MFERLEGDISNSATSSRLGVTLGLRKFTREFKLKEEVRIAFRLAILKAYDVEERTQMESVTKSDFLCENSVILCASVVKLRRKKLTAETLSFHRDPQRISQLC